MGLNAVLGYLIRVTSIPQEHLAIVADRGKQVFVVVMPSNIFHNRRVAAICSQWMQRFAFLLVCVQVPVTHGRVLRGTENMALANRVP